MAECRECGGPITLPAHPGSPRLYCSMRCHTAMASRLAAAKRAAAKRCPDSATCTLTPVRGVCPMHAEHAAARDEYAEAEAAVRALRQHGDG